MNEIEKLKKEIEALKALKTPSTNTENNEIIASIGKASYMPAKEVICEYSNVEGSTSQRALSFEMPCFTEADISSKNTSLYKCFTLGLKLPFKDKNEMIKVGNFVMKLTLTSHKLDMEKEYGVQKKNEASKEGLKFQKG